MKWGIFISAWFLVGCLFVACSNSRTEAEVNNKSQIQTTTLLDVNTGNNDYRLSVYYLEVDGHKIVVNSRGGLLELKD